MIPFSDEELQDPVEMVIDSVRPMLLGDGGNIEILRIKNGVVYVRLVGACHGCSASSQTLKYGIERQLKAEIHPEITIVNVPYGEDLPFE